MDLYKLVVRDKNGKVVQIHECYQNSIEGHILIECDTKGYSVTVTKL